MTNTGFSSGSQAANGTNTGATAGGFPGPFPGGVPPNYQNFIGPQNMEQQFNYINSMSDD
jgi:hypothetical protein